MRQLALLLLGALLLALSSAFCRIFHLQWLHPDPTILLAVLIALELPVLEGGLLVAVLGLFSDTFASTPTGMLASAHLVVWMAVRGFKLLLVPDSRMVQLGILFAMSLFFSLLTMIQLVIMDTDTGLIWVNLKAMLPLGVINVALAVPVWALARWIIGSSSRPQPGII